MPYNFKRESDPAGFAFDPLTASFSVGDLMYWASGYVDKMTASTDGASFVGVAMGQNPIASNIDNVPGLENETLIKQTGIFTFKTTSGDSLVHGNPVVMGADAQTVLLRTVEPLTDVIGYMWRPNIPLGSVSTGVELTEVKIRANFPDPNLAS